MQTLSSGEKDLLRELNTRDGNEGARIDRLDSTAWRQITSN